jgi:hypothetical protein
MSGIPEGISEDKPTTPAASLAFFVDARRVSPLVKPRFQPHRSLCGRTLKGEP